MKRDASTTRTRDRSGQPRRGLLLLVVLVGSVGVEASGLLPDAGEVRLAYLDPGSGSFMIQALVAALAGIAVTVRTYWSKIRVFFGGAPPEPDDDPVVNTNDE